MAELERDLGSWPVLEERCPHYWAYLTAAEEWAKLDSLEQLLRQPASR